MSTVQIRNVMAHARAADEASTYGRSIEEIALLLVKYWHALSTPGSRVKALRHTPGNDYRLRVRHLRAVFSVIGEVAFIHLVDRRDTIYDSRQFDLRLDRFRRAIDCMSDSTAEVVRKLGYSGVHYQHTAAPLVEPNEVSISYALRRQQRTFFSSVLPLHRLGRSLDPSLIVGHGPPGAGKTVVAANLALEAAADGHSVDVLVPSDQLIRQYLAQFRAEGLEVADEHGSRGSVRVMRFDRWFARRAGLDVRFDREGEAIALLRHHLSSEEGRRLLQTKARDVAEDVRTLERLPILADALLADDAWWNDLATWRTKRKDAMVDAAFPFIEALFRLRDWLLDKLEVSSSQDVWSRCELALKPAADHWHPARLTIVDEAQDMAPAEWRVLLQDVLLNSSVGRHGDPDPDCRLVLLGDMRQRVSYVPFSWDDVTRHAHTVCGIPPKRIVKLDVDTESYRMKRAVARAALASFDRCVYGRDSSRQHGRLDVDALAIGGSVCVAVLPPGHYLIDEALRDFSARVAAEPMRHLFCVHGPKSRQRLASMPGLINHSVRDAKGLEADGVLVLLPFSSSGQRRQTLDHDEATEFYTAVSRARDKLLLVIDPPSWELLKLATDAWQGADVRIDSGVSAQWLRDVLEQLSVHLSREDVVRHRLKQLEGLCGQPSLDQVDLLKGLDEVFHALTRHADGEVLPDIVNNGAVLASCNPEAFSHLRDRYASRPPEPPTLVDVIRLAFLGEFARALSIGSQLGPEVASWLEWLELLLEESPIQRWLSIAAESGLSEEATIAPLCAEVLTRLRDRRPIEGDASLLAGIQAWRTKRDPLALSAADQRVEVLAIHVLVKAREKLLEGKRQLLEPSFGQWQIDADRLEERLMAVRSKLLSLNR